MIRDHVSADEVHHDLAEMVNLNDAVFQPMTAARDEENDYQIDLLKVRYDRMDEAAHHQEQLDLQQRINAIIAKVTPLLNGEELSLLYWATGIHKQEQK